jgi:hypothetical protein
MTSVNIHGTLSYSLKHAFQNLFRSIKCKCTSTTSGQGTVLQIGRSLVRFQMVSFEFFIDIILPIALWPWGRLSL